MIKTEKKRTKRDNDMESKGPSTDETRFATSHQNLIPDETMKEVLPAVGETDCLWMQLNPSTFFCWTEPLPTFGKGYPGSILIKANNNTIN